MYRAVVYDKNNEGFWRFSRIVNTEEEAMQKAKNIIKKYKPEVADIRIVKQ